MIFRQHKTILLHTPRTGGTTLEAGLAYPDTKEAVEDAEPWHNKHLDGLRAERCWGDEFMELDIVAILRSPFGLVLSQFIQNSKTPPTVNGFRSWLHKSKILLPTSAEVDPYLPDMVPAGTPSAGISQRRFLESSRFSDYKFLRFSRLEEDIKGLYAALGITRKLRHIGRRSKMISMLPKKPDGGLDLCAIYRPRDEALIRRKFWEDIRLCELHGEPCALDR